jgi:L-ascorbate metabolism protein UlaG (beta-lactamase superfamily)
VSFLLDPFFEREEWFTPSPITAKEASADFILVSHGHHDHLGESIEISKRTGVVIITTYELACHCKNQGATVDDYHVGGRAKYPWGWIKLTPFFHGSAFRDLTWAGVPCGFLCHVEDHNFYFAGDTALTLEMKLWGDEVPLDLAILPIGGRYVMDADDAVTAVKFLRPKFVIPIHFAKEKVDPAHFVRRVESETPSKVVLLDAGESFTIR